MSLVTLPREVQLIIFDQLNVPDLLRVSKTCHHLKEVARDPCLWKKLTLTYEKVKNKNEACKDHVSRCSSLREIFITGEEKAIRSDRIMAVVMKARDTLTSINLSPSFAGLANSSFEKIGSMTQLTHLAVGGGKLGTGGTAALACLTELRSLKVPGIFCGNFVVRGTDTLPVSSSMAALVDLFSTLQKLEEVEIKMDRSYPSDLVLKSLVNNNPNLHHLDISSNTTYNFRRNPNDELSSRSLILLADKCPQLTYIGIANLTMFSSTSIAQLVTNCPKLKHANFEQTMVDDSALGVMSKKCTELEHLSISNCDRITQGGLERFVYPAYAAKLKFLDVKEDCDRFPMIFNTHFLNRLKYDLPNLKIVTDDYDYIEDVSYDSDENFYEHYNSSASDEDDDEGREDCTLM